MPLPIDYTAPSFDPNRTELLQMMPPRPCLNMPEFLTSACSPLAGVWLKTWCAGVAAGHRAEIVDALAKHFRNADHPELLPRRTAAATNHAQASRLSTLSMETNPEPPAKRAHAN